MVHGSSRAKRPLESSTARTSEFDSRYYGEIRNLSLCEWTLKLTKVRFRFFNPKEKNLNVLTITLNALYKMSQD